MKVVFFGTPDFAVPALNLINKSHHELVGVVTVADKQQGRGLKTTFSPVKQYAVDNNILVLQPDSLKDPVFIQALSELHADIFVVVAFRILPAEVFTLPPHGSFNLHGSLLPKYRGAAPIQWAIINGETETGVTSFKLAQKVDTGNMYLQKRTTIGPDETLGDLHDRMALLGAETIIETLHMIESGTAVLLPQDDTLARPAPKITKETCQINWNKTAAEVRNLIRGVTPFPGAFFIQNDNSYKVFKTRLTTKPSSGAGDIQTTKDEILIGCADYYLQILEIQKEGRKRMTAEEFLRGYSF
ncbi:MAG: methionyl-tRNA formyltransferase [Ignavibacteria bacterium]|nr:methionyl-tRNA formyltransferase [Ignavibacteria bacterium]